MKKLFALITSVIMAVALFAFPITASADEPVEDTGTVLVDIDFSDSTVIDDFGGTWGAWIIDETNEVFRPESPWSNTKLNQAIEFEGKRIVLTVDFVIEYTEDPNLMPALTIGMTNSEGRGAVIRFLIDNESLYSHAFGTSGWFMDSQWKFIQEELTVRTLEMTFDIDKTLTVKVDGEVLTHSNGNSMSKINLVEMFDGFAENFVGYFTVMASGGKKVEQEEGYEGPDVYTTDTYIDNLKIVAYDTPASEEDPPAPVQPDDPDPSGDEPSQVEPSTPNNNEPLNGNNVEKGGCGSAISGFSIAALVLASGTTIAVFRKKKEK